MSRLRSYALAGPSSTHRAARALDRKVRDEFTVPLCALHHHDLHMKGNEAEWWWGHTIDPLPIAERLWLTTRKGVNVEPSDGSTAAE